MKTALRILHKHGFGLCCPISRRCWEQCSQRAASPALWRWQRPHCPLLVSGKKARNAPSSPCGFSKISFVGRVVGTWPFTWWNSCPRVCKRRNCHLSEMPDHKGKWSAIAQEQSPSLCLGQKAFLSPSVPITALPQAFFSPLHCWWHGEPRKGERGGCPVLLSCHGDQLWNQCLPRHNSKHSVMC